MPKAIDPRGYDELHEKDAKDFTVEPD